MKKSIGFIIVFVLVGMCIHTSTHAADGEKLFETKCGKCHVHGNAPPFFPVKYASSQWKRFFSKDKHSRKRDISGEVTPEEIKIIEKYLTDHAADSDLPIAAGQR